MPPTPDAPRRASQPGRRDHVRDQRFSTTSPRPSSDAHATKLAGRPPHRHHPARMRRARLSDGGTGPTPPAGRRAQPCRAAKDMAASGRDRAAGTGSRCCRSGLGMPAEAARPPLRIFTLPAAAIEGDRLLLPLARHQRRCGRRRRRRRRRPSRIRLRRERRVRRRDSRRRSQHGRSRHVRLGMRRRPCDARPE
jgi:hypothetical protein